MATVWGIYAYFITRIIGNTKDKSIDVTTRNLQLVYGDGKNTILEPNIKLFPSEQEIGTKDFTVTNNGEDTSYTVVIEDTKTFYATNGSYKEKDGTVVTYTKDQPTEFLTNDFRYTLDCVVKDKITLLSSGYDVKSFLLNLICSANSSEVFQSFRLKKLP